MDDLDAVLASLEHTEANLRSIPASSKDLEANFNDIDADLDAVFENTQKTQTINTELHANIEAIFDAGPHLTHGDVSKLGVTLEIYKQYQRISDNNIADFKELDKDWDSFTLAIKKRDLELYQMRFDIAKNSLQRLFDLVSDPENDPQVNISTETATLTRVQRVIDNLYNSQMKKLYVASKVEVETNDSKFDENGLELLKDQHDIKQNELNDYIRTYNEVNELYDQLLAQINIFKGEQMFDNGKSQENVWIEKQKEKLQEKFESRKQKIDEKFIKQSQQADTRGKQADIPGQQAEAQRQEADTLFKEYQQMNEIVKKSIDKFWNKEHSYRNSTIEVKRNYKDDFDNAYGEAIRRLFDVLNICKELKKYPTYVDGQSLVDAVAYFEKEENSIKRRKKTEEVQFYEQSKQEAISLRLDFRNLTKEYEKKKFILTRGEKSKYVTEYQSLYDSYKELFRLIESLSNEQMSSEKKNKEREWVTQELTEIDDQYQIQSSKIQIAKESIEEQTEEEDQNCTLKDYFEKIKREKSCIIRFEQYIRELKNEIHNTMPQISKLNDENKRGYFLSLQAKQLEARSKYEEAQKAVQDALQKINAMKRVILDDNTDVKSDKLRDWKQESESQKKSFDEIESFFTDLYDNINRPKSQQHSKTEEKGDKKSSAKILAVISDVEFTNMTRPFNLRILRYEKYAEEIKTGAAHFQRQIDARKLTSRNHTILNQLDVWHHKLNELYQDAEAARFEVVKLIDTIDVIRDDSANNLKNDKERKWMQMHHNNKRLLDLTEASIKHLRQQLHSKSAMYSDEHEEKEWSRDRHFSYTHHTTEQASVQHTEFSTRLNQFARTLIDLVYPPTPAPPWSTPSSSAPAHSIFSTKSNTTRSNPNKQLADLCNHIAHITAVSNRFPAIAAMRLLFEFSPNGALLSKFTQSQQSAKTVRPLQQHQNMEAIAKHLTGNRFSQLHRDADEFLSSFVSRAQQQRASHEQLEDHENHEIQENHEKRASHGRLQQRPREHKPFMSRITDYVTQTAHDIVEVHTPRAGVQKTQHTQQAARQESKKQESTEIDTSEQESTKNATGKEAAGQDDMEEDNGSWWKLFGRNKNRKKGNKGRSS